jgi:hypothetical protein
VSAGQSHITSIVVNRRASDVFAFMADAQRMHRWSFGTWETEVGADGLVKGKSLFDGAVIYVRIDADAGRLAVDYHLGAEPERLTPRIHVRVVPGERLGLAGEACVLTFVAWRAQSMDEDRWRRLTASHELEVVLIKAMLEAPLPSS